jgi:5-methylcytosine-specific restriction enzyme B
MKLFFGKISQEFSEQHEGNFYAGGDKNSSSYNGLEIGDYVFPIYGGKITKLWKVREYSDTPDPKNKFNRKAVLFDVVRDFKNPIHLATQFCRFNYFDLDLNLLNKSSKSTSSEQKGFYEISTLNNCPPPENIDLENARSILIALENASFSFSENDVRITIKGDSDEYKIIDIQIFTKGQFIRYQTLWDLYNLKNKDKYSINQLLKFAKEDEAPKKENYLTDVISDLDEKGIFIVSSPIALYDNVLVGRKRTAKKKIKNESLEVAENLDDIDEAADILKFDKYKSYVDLLNFNPNIILYGPPGTGKTFTAQRIIEANEYILTKDPTVKFEEIKKEGRVEFITFHQSYSYEEFVEGIRPVISTDENNESQVSGIRYEIKPGILRNIANNASLNLLQENDNNLPLKEVKKASKIYKVSLGERNTAYELYKQCKKDNFIAIGWLENLDLSGKDYNFIYEEIKKEKPADSPEPTNDASSINIFVNELQKGDIVFIYDGPFTIRDIGIITGDYLYEEKRDEYPHTRKVKWIKEFKDNPLDISSYNSNIRLTMKTIYPLTRITFDDLVSIIGEEESKLEKSKSGKPFYIIIDEINRGNISKIFGELITLIEKDKRDTLKLTLPYSQKPFSVPSNLFFIGTMNTADRSIAILDTALRRRFAFIELEPDSEVIHSIGDNPVIDGKIDMSELLDAVNEKIENLYDRDHRIGHSYFLNATNMKSFKHVWYYQIIPLLLEYFYNDGKKISEIIGSAFIDVNNCSIKTNLSNDEFVEAILKICNK